MHETRILRLPHLMIGLSLLLLFQTTAIPASDTDPFPVGSQLPRPTLGAPDSPDAQKYLGLKSCDPFTISEIGSKLVLIEFIGAF
jgi:hypothetical protein